MSAVKLRSQEDGTRLRELLTALDQAEARKAEIARSHGVHLPGWVEACAQVEALRERVREMRGR